MRKTVIEEDSIAVVVLTNAERRDVLLATIASAESNLGGTIGRRVIADDSRTSEATAWLRLKFPGWEVTPLPRPRIPFTVVWVGKRRGGIRLRRHSYCHAVQGAISVAVGSGCRWVFWLEDDFTFQCQIPLDAMKSELMKNPHLAQLSLKRQPWYPYEVAAGDILNTYPPESIVQHDAWVSHRHWFTMNPMLCRRSLFVNTPWPGPPDCERRFGEALRQDPRTVFGMWGQISDPPRVFHIGESRAASGEY